MNSWFSNSLLAAGLRRSQKLLLWGFFALIVIYTLCIYFSAPIIESSLSKEVGEIMRVRGFDRVSTRANGRDIVLVGNVSSDSAALSALKFAASGWGVRKITSELELKPLRLPHLVLQRKINGEIKVTGEVPRQEDVIKILEIIQRYTEANSVQYSVAANPEVTDPNWIELVDAVLQESDQINGLEIEIGAGQISIGGLIPNESSYGVFLKRIDQFSLNYGLELVNGVGIKPSASEIAAYYGDPSLSLDESDKKKILPVDPIISESLENEMDEEYEGETDKETALGTQFENDSLTESSTADIQSAKGDIPKGNENNASEELEDRKNKENCQMRINESILQEPIVFSSGSVKLSVDSSTILTKLSNIMKMCPTYGVLIRGHTDSDGQEASNLRLSQLRAESVMNGLVERGIGKHKIEAKGYGSIFPVATNATSAGKRLNRRIEVQLD